MAQLHAHMCHEFSRYRPPHVRNKFNFEINYERAMVDNN